MGSYRRGSISGSTSGEVGGRWEAIAPVVFASLIFSLLSYSNEPPIPLPTPPPHPLTHPHPPSLQTHIYIYIFFFSLTQYFYYYSRHYQTI